MYHLAAGARQCEMWNIARFERCRHFESPNLRFVRPDCSKTRKKLVASREDIRANFAPFHVLGGGVLGLQRRKQTPRNFTLQSSNFQINHSLVRPLKYIKWGGSIANDGVLFIQLKSVLRTVWNVFSTAVNANSRYGMQYTVCRFILLSLPRAGHLYGGMWILVQIWKVPYPDSPLLTETSPLPGRYGAQTSLGKVFAQHVTHGVIRSRMFA